MTIISMILIGVLIVLNLFGIKNSIENKKIASKVTDDDYVGVGMFSSCLGFLIYFIALLITAFVIDDKVAVLSIIFVILAELAEMFSRFSKVNASKSYKEMYQKMDMERRDFKYVFVEVSEFIIFVFLFAKLFQQL